MYRLLRVALPATALGVGIAEIRSRCDETPHCSADWPDCAGCCQETKGNRCTENRYNVITTIHNKRVWTVAARDVALEPYGMTMSRMVILKLPAADDEEAASLVLVNGVPLCESTVESIRKLEKAEVAKVRYVIAPSEHPMWTANLWQYNLEFPEATVYLPPPAVVDDDVCLGQNFTFEHLEHEEPLAFLRPHLQVQYVAGLGRLGRPSNELVLFHEATDSFVVGDFMWYFSCEPRLDWPLPFSQETLRGAQGKVFVRQHDGASSFLDMPAAKTWAKQLMKLPVNSFIPVHGYLGGLVLSRAAPGAWNLLKEALTHDDGPLCETCAARR